MNRKKSLRPEEQLLKIGSSGRSIWGAEVKVVNDQHDPLSMGQEGEIRVRGPNVCQGYYKYSEEQKKRFFDGWYYTGDIGRFDDDGYLYVVGRMKDIIKTGSINVAPKEVEEVLLFHPDVGDATVVGVADPEWGESIQAYVVLRRQHAIDERRQIGSPRNIWLTTRRRSEFGSSRISKRNELGKVTAINLSAVKEVADG